MELSTYWSEEHYVRGTLKVPRTFIQFIQKTSIVLSKMTIFMQKNVKNVQNVPFWVSRGYMLSTNFGMLSTNFGMLSTNFGMLSTNFGML